MKNLVIYSFLVLVSLGGAAVQASQEKASLVIFRTVELAKYGGIHYKISVDGEYQGKLRPHSIITLELNPGEHIIQASDKQGSTLVVNLKAGETTYINGSIDNSKQLVMAVAQPTPKVLTKVATEKALAGTH